MKGFGLSPRPRDGRYSVYDQSALVLAYIADHHLTNVTILGHSFGGGVALATAAELEETQPGVLSKLVLIDAASYKQDLPWFISILRIPVIGSLSQHLLTSRAQVRKVLKNAYYNDTLITAEQVEAYAAPLFTDGGKYALRETAKQILPKNVDELSARYPHIKVPTLIIWGVEDRVVPLANGVRLDDAIPNSTLVKIEKCGHIPHEELPDAVRKPLADFLR
jgi:pimeloyl-ACP methyl ester carboxylesterase